MEKEIRNTKPHYLRIFLTGVLIGGMAYALMRGLFLNSSIIGNSMSPTLLDGDRTLGLRMQEFERGDVVSFYPKVDKEKLYVKRVIGLPGETVEIRDAEVYIDGTKLDEPYIGEWTEHTGSWVFQVPEGHYLVLGDNRNDSYDSRSWPDPYVPEEDIVAKAWFAFRTGEGFRQVK